MLMLLQSIGERRLGLSIAPLDAEYDNNITEESTAIALNISHN